MDAANIPSGLVSAQAAVNAAATNTTETAITSAPVQQPSTVATVSVSQGQVQTDLSQTNSDAVGPTFQLKIMIEQTIVQFLGQLDKLLAKPQTLADFLPESIRQDMQQVLSDKLFAATPATLEQGLTATIKTNKETADSFSQLAKGLNMALTFQDELPDSAQKFLLTAKPALTELLIQIRSEIDQQPSALPMSPIRQEAGGGGQPAQNPQTATVPATAFQSTVLSRQATISKTVLPSNPLGIAQDFALPAETVTAVPASHAETVIAAQPSVVENHAATAESPTVNLGLTNKGLAAEVNPIVKALGSTASQLSAAVTDASKGSIVQQLADNSNFPPDLVAPESGTAVSQLAADPITVQGQASSPVENQQITDKRILLKPLAAQNNKAATESKDVKSDAKVVTQQSTIPVGTQAVISYVLAMNNPPVPTGPVGVDEFFNWIAQQFRQNQDNPDLQENLQQKIDVWSAPLSQLSEIDSKAFTEIKQQLEQQLPSQLRQIATQIPALKDLYVYNKMSDLAKYANLSQDKLYAAKESISRLAESFQKSLVDSLSFHSETGSSGKVFTFFMPISFEGTTLFPAHIHIYHQNQPEKRGGPLVAETWLRVFLKTDYSGTVTLLFHVRQQLVDMKLGFSDKQAAQDFYPWLPDIRQSLANSPFTLQHIQVFSA